MKPFLFCAAEIAIFAVSYALPIGLQIAGNSRNTQNGSFKVFETTLAFRERIIEFQRSQINIHATDEPRQVLPWHRRTEFYSFSKSSKMFSAIKMPHQHKTRIRI